MNVRLRVLFLLVLFFVFYELSAQPSTISLVHYTTDNGLSHDEVNSIYKDHDGFMWFGTTSGLNRFDGRIFKAYLHIPGNDKSLPGNRIGGMIEDDKGRLWVATGSGMCYLDKTTQFFHLIPMPEQTDSIVDNESVTHMAIDQDGFGWFGTVHNLVRINLQTLETRRFPYPDELGSGGIVTIDRKNRIWVNILSNIYRFDQHNFTFHYYSGRLMLKREGLAMGEIYQDEDGELWSGSWGSGLFRYNEAKDVFEDFPDGNTIAVMPLKDKDSDGKTFFWIGGGVDGLYLFYPDEKKAYRMLYNPREPYSHNGFMARALYKDSATGIVWIATDSGIEKYDTHTIKFRRGLIPVDEASSQFNFVSWFVPDKTDPTGQHYWIGVWTGGFYYWDRKNNTFQHFDIRQGLSHNEVFCVQQDKTGKVYLGVTGGLDIYDPKTGKFEFRNEFFKTPNVIHKILTMHIDHAGRLWMGANYEGLFCYDPQTRGIQKVSLIDSLPEADGVRFISGIQEDAQHRLWVSTYSGLIRYNPATGEKILFRDHGFPHRYRSDGVFLGKNGIVWVATVQGLIRADTTGHVLYHYRSADGLKSEEIYKVIEDKTGMAWLATTNILHRVNPKTHQIDYYNRNDGLFSNSQSDAFNITDDGEIFIGYQNAFNYFDPAAIPLNTMAPKVVLTDLQVLNEERNIKPGETIKLHPNENVITFSFAALNFSQPNKNRYAFMLEGFDNQWIYTEHPFVSYTNLDGGTYTFRVKASNNDGIWNEEGLSITMQVIPPFQKTWTFAGLMALLVGGILAGIFAYQQQQQRRVEVIRERIARDLHDDMGSTLSSIRFFSEFARSKVANPEVSPVLQRISESAAALSESMQDIIWAINTKNDQLDDLLTRMRQFGLKLLEAQGIAFKVQVSEGFRPARLNIGQRRNIYLIFKEAINNAAKYADCNQVELHIELVINQLKMVISDNGKGFNQQEIERGNGLDNMKKRAAEIGGTIQITPCVNGGTKIELAVKL